MRLIFLYTRDRCTNPSSFSTEGLHLLFLEMIKASVIDEIRVIIDSYTRNEFVPFCDGYICQTVNGLGQNTIEPDDVVWVRGGFKPWLPTIDRCRERKQWLLFYGANTGRERWPFWDIVFDDLTGTTRMDESGRLWLDYRKPMNEHIFKLLWGKSDRKYDLCIGASHIHDKKGQWRGVKAAAAYRGKYGKNLRCVLPGGFYRGVKTNRMPAEIRNFGLDIEMPGMLPRTELARVMNESKIFCHLGSGGQGDRGPMEAMACGCNVMIGFPKYHAKWLCEAPYCLIPEDPEDFDEVAELIHGALENPFSPHEVAGFQAGEAGVEKQSLPMMRQLFNFFKRHPSADRNALREVFDAD